MKRQTILPSSRATDVPFGNKSRMRAAALAALSVTAIILGVIVLSPKEQENIDVELQSVATLAIGPVQLATPMPSSVHTPVPTSMLEVSESSAPSATPLQKKEGEGLFTLHILNDTISVAYGVEEATLKKTPGWLSTSALPGKEGMCVVYGHRNRNHLKVLERWSAAIRLQLRWMALSTPIPFRTSQFTKTPAIYGSLLWMAGRLCW